MKMEVGTMTMQKTFGLIQAALYNPILTTTPKKTKVQKKLKKNTMMTQMSIKKKNSKKKLTPDNLRAGNALDKLTLQAMRTGGEIPQPDDTENNSMTHQAILMRTLLGMDTEHQVVPMPSQVSPFLGTSAGTTTRTRA